MRKAAYRVRELKGSPRHGIGLAVGGLIRCIGREQGFIIPVSVRVADDVCASLPCILGPDGAERAAVAGDERRRARRLGAFAGRAARRREDPADQRLNAADATG